MKSAVEINRTLNDTNTILFQELIEIDDWLRLDLENYLKYCPAFAKDGMADEIQFLKEWLDFSEADKIANGSKTQPLLIRLIGVYARFPNPLFQKNNYTLDQDLTSPLIIALLTGKKLALAALIKAGAVKNEDMLIRLAMHAIKQKDLELFDIIVSNPDSIPDTKKIIAHCLHESKIHAEGEFELKALTLLVRYCTDTQINQQIRGTTDEGVDLTIGPLGFAVINDLLATTAILLAHPAIDIFTEDSRGYNAFGLAKKNKNDPMKKLLVKDIARRIYWAAYLNELTPEFKSKAMGILSKHDIAAYILEHAKSVEGHQNAIDTIDGALTRLKDPNSQVQPLLLGLAMHRALNNLIGELQTERSRRQTLLVANDNGTTRTFIKSPAAASSSRQRPRDDSEDGVEMEKMSAYDDKNDNDVNHNNNGF